MISSGVLPGIGIIMITRVISSRVHYSFPNESSNELGTWTRLQTRLSNYSDSLLVCVKGRTPGFPRWFQISQISPLFITFALFITFVRHALRVYNKNSLRIHFKRSFKKSESFVDRVFQQILKIFAFKTK